MCGITEQRDVSFILITDTQRLYSRQLTSTRSLFMLVLAVYQLNHSHKFVESQIPRTRTVIIFSSQDIKAYDECLNLLFFSFVFLKKVVSLKNMKRVEFGKM